jgi:hypothetical protein
MWNKRRQCVCWKWMGHISTRHRLPASNLSPDCGVADVKVPCTSANNSQMKHWAQKHRSHLWKTVHESSI